MQRILVYGVTGSGKSMLAARIGEQLGLPYHAVDDLTISTFGMPSAASNTIQSRCTCPACAVDDRVSSGRRAPSTGRKTNAAATDTATVARARTVKSVQTRDTSQADTKGTEI